MIYRGPGFLAVVLFGSSHPFLPIYLSMLDRRLTERLRRKGEEEGEGE
jgi:hypothetical protein